MDSTPDRMNKILECYVDFVEDADPMEEFPVVVHSPCHTAKHQLCEPDRSPRSRSPLMRLRSSNESLITQIVDRKVAVLKDEILTELRGELGKKRPLLDSGSDVFPKAVAYNLPMALGVTQTKQSTGASRASQEQSSVNTDMQVLKTGTEILQALDGFWDKFRTLGGHGRANVTATFCPTPPVVTAFDLKRRVCYGHRGSGEGRARLQDALGTPRGAAGPAIHQHSVSRICEDDFAGSLPARYACDEGA